MSLTDDQRNQTLELLTLVGAIETSLLRAKSQLADIRYRLNVILWPVKDLDDVDRGYGKPSCRHDVPLGEYCPYCTETPEG